MFALVRSAVESVYAVQLGLQAGPLMHCLDCSHELEFASRGWWCPSCKAELWLFSRLSSFHHEPLTRYLTAHALPMEYPALGRPCPGCGEAFAVVTAPKSASDDGRASWARTRVDVCIPCGWVWLDPGELSEVSAQES